MNKAGTHLNKCAEMPVDSKTPSDRQASFKSTPQSTQNAFLGGLASVSSNYFTAEAMRGVRAEGSSETPRVKKQKKMSRAAPLGRKTS